MKKMEIECRSVRFELEVESALSVAQRQQISQDAFPGKQISQETFLEKQMFIQILNGRMFKTLRCITTNRDYYKEKYFEAEAERKELEFNLKELQFQLQECLDEMWERKASESLDDRRWRRFEIPESLVPDCKTCLARHEYQMASLGLKREIEIETGQLFNIENFAVNKGWRFREAVFGDLFKRLTDFVRNWLTYNN